MAMTDSAGSRITDFVGEVRYDCPSTHGFCGRGFRVALPMLEGLRLGGVVVRVATSADSAIPIDVEHDEADVCGSGYCYSAGTPILFHTDYGEVVDPAAEYIAITSLPDINDNTWPEVATLRELADGTPQVLVVDSYTNELIQTLNFTPTSRVTTGLTWLHDINATTIRRLPCCS